MQMARFLPHPRCCYKFTETLNACSHPHRERIDKDLGTLATFDGITTDDLIGETIRHL